MQTLLDDIKQLEEEFVYIRHHIHKNPELGFEEDQTSNLIAKLLAEWGYKVHRGLAKTGIVGTLKVGTSNKVLGIRADIDALPVTDKGSKSWCSKNQGKSHSCGHDGHTTILLCAAKYLAETRNFDGTLNVIFQPAEELLYGGRVMLEDGLFEKFPCDAVFAMHNMPGFKTGHFYFRQGPLMASCDTIHIQVSGVGAHGAMPERSVDATIVACYIATALQTIISRNVPASEAAVITIGSITSGHVPNIINDSALMKLSVRALNPDIRELLLKRINEIAVNQAQSFGAEATVTHVNGCPVLINGEEMTKFACNIATELFGQEMVEQNSLPQFMGSEDFAFMLEKNPNGCYLIIGNGDESGYHNVHNPRYDFNDECIVPAAAYWAALTQTYLNKQS